MWQCHEQLSGRGWPSRGDLTRQAITVSFRRSPLWARTARTAAAEDPNMISWMDRVGISVKRSSTSVAPTAGAP
jgi:hypothetical protein